MIQDLLQLAGDVIAEDEGFHIPRAVWRWLPWVIGIVITAVCALPFFVGRNSVQKHFSGYRAPKGSIPAVGKILSKQPTGTLINDVRVWKVHVEATQDNGTVSRGTIQRPIPDYEINALAEGASLPVMIDPKKPDQFYFVKDEMDQERAQQLFDSMRVQQGLSEQPSQELLNNGIDTQGVLKSLVPTGKMLHGEAQFTIEVAVTGPNGDAITLTKNAYCPPNIVSHLHVGRIVEVRYLPNDPSQFQLSLSTIE